MRSKLDLISYKAAVSDAKSNVISRTWFTFRSHNLQYLRRAIQLPINCPLAVRLYSPHLSNINDAAVSIQQ